jgi:hypothetical protein
LLIYSNTDDQYFAETNLIVTNVLQIHNNVLSINGQDAGESVEEDISSYITKEGASLYQAAAIM